MCVCVCTGLYLCPVLYEGGDYEVEVLSTGQHLQWRGQAGEEGEGREEGRGQLQSISQHIHSKGRIMLLLEQLYQRKHGLEDSE